MARPPLRAWQEAAFAAWQAERNSGIVSVVTGGGKTVFALHCIDHLKASTTLVVVPTLALLDQWWEEASAFLGLRLDDIHIVKGRGSLRKGTVNLAVINSASQLPHPTDGDSLFLIVDECHRAASEQFGGVLLIPHSASLGLSATPERPYDTGLEQQLIPALGRVIYSYTYADALRDGVIVPFELLNVVFALDAETKEEYDSLTRRIGRSMSQYGPEAQETIRLLLRRSRALSRSLERVRLTVKIIASTQARSVVVFHEDIEACTLIHRILRENGVSTGLYHSRLTLRARAEVLSAYRRGEVRVLVTCKALDEGFNVPETEVGIIAASTATRRQRIQRLGRVLRPSKGKGAALVYTLVATDPEIKRLEDEERDLEGVATVKWVKA